MDGGEFRVPVVLHGQGGIGIGPHAARADVSFDPEVGWPVMSNHRRADGGVEARGVEDGQVWRGVRRGVTDAIEQC